MCVKASILITKGIETMYSFKTEKGRRNEKGEGRWIDPCFTEEETKIQGKAMQLGNVSTGV